MWIFSMTKTFPRVRTFKFVKMYECSYRPLKIRRCSNWKQWLNLKKLDYKPNYQLRTTNWEKRNKNLLDYLYNTKIYKLKLENLLSWIVVPTRKVNVERLSRPKFYWPKTFSKLSILYDFSFLIFKKLFN